MSYISYLAFSWCYLFENIILFCISYLQSRIDQQLQDNLLLYFFAITIYSILFFLFLPANVCRPFFPYFGSSNRMKLLASSFHCCKSRNLNHILFALHHFVIIYFASPPCLSNQHFKHSYFRIIQYSHPWLLCHQDPGLLLFECNG